MMNRESVSRFLLRHAAARPVSFHMPGHKGSELYRRFGYDNFLDAVMDCDITEIPGADNLFQQEDVILAVMDKYKKLYGSKKTYLLINGSSAGIIASVLSLAGSGDKLIMARNCHKSVFNAVSLGNIRPLYLYPEMLDDFGIQGQIEPREVERLLDENPETAAVIIPSPNYYGICSDIETIAQICHRKGARLIVDQAHGAHLKFMDELSIGGEIAAGENCGAGCYRGGRECGERKGKFLSAELAGADIVINSTHKTLASFTQTAILNVMSEDIDRKTIEDKLQILESSSPSYPLLASLDINADIMLKHGKELIEEWNDNIGYFYENAKKIDGLRVVIADGLDRTKINLDMSACGLNGNELEELMMKDGIYAELVTGNILMCMTGIGNVREDFDRLLNLLRKTAADTALVRGRAKKIIGASEENSEESFDLEMETYDFEKIRWENGRCNENRSLRAVGAPSTPLETTDIPTKKELIDIKDSEGRVCAGLLIPYPPGIPIICPGEVMTAEIIEYIIGLRKAKEKVIGIDEKNRIAVGASYASSALRHTKESSL